MLSTSVGSPSSHFKFNRAEEELLLLLARTVIGTEEQRRIEEILAMNIDWSYLFDTALYHGLFPLVYNNLQKYHDLDLSSALAERSKRNYLTIVSKNMALTGELISVLRKFQANNVIAIPIKGPTLAQLAYGDISLRMTSDLDILVSDDKIEDATQILIRMGYEKVTEVDDEDAVEQGKVFHHDNFIKSYDLHIELHRALEPAYFWTGGNTELFWENIKPVSCFGMMISMPRNEDMFLYLCRHGTRHAWRRLKWLCDLAQFLQTYPELDWAYMVRQAEHGHTRRLLLTSLALTNRLFGSPLPENLSNEIQRDKRIGKIVSQMLELIFLPPDSVPIQERYLIEQLQIIQQREGWLQRLSYSYRVIARKARPSVDDRSTVALPERFSFLYYFLRVWRLLRIYALAFERRVIKREHR